MSESIVLAGSMLVDNVKMISRWPDKGMLVQISSVKRAVGGAVCNSGIDLKTLDPSITVKALGKIGDDDAGDFVVSTLEGKGLDCSLVSRVAGVPTSFTDVMTVEETGERTFFNMHGADSALVPDDIDAAKLNCGIFHFGYLLLLDGMDAADEEYGTKAARLLAKVRAAGIKTSIDIVSEQSERFARIVRPALRYCDYVVINEVEGSMATGVPADDMRGICEGLFELGVGERVVVHRPETGVTMGRGGDFVEVPSLELPSGWIKGSVGAGDAFCAGILYSLLKGTDPEYALRLASCAAAMNLASSDSTGGAKSLAETMELEKLFQRRAK
ncbi:MAG: carbohydrate kinase family protein [Kiritimatiellae bacterium]|nr:carbohydrate kinase family protein [Kiritimatiellia bacterium]